MILFSVKNLRIKTKVQNKVKIFLKVIFNWQFCNPSKTQRLINDHIDTNRNAVKKGITKNKVNDNK